MATEEAYKFERGFIFIINISIILIVQLHEYFVILMIFNGNIF